MKPETRNQINSSFVLDPSAFSLIELIIVIFIMSLTAALVMPNLWGSGKKDLKSEAKRIAGTLRYIYDEAAGKKEAYYLKIDLDDNSMSYKSENENRIFKMKENVMFKDIIIPSLGEISSGELTLEFAPSGPEEPIILHLIKGGSEYTVFFNHINGRAKIKEGYVLETS